MVSPQLARLFEQNSPARVLILQTDGPLDTCSARLRPPPPLLSIPSLACSRCGGEASMTDLLLRNTLAYVLDQPPGVSRRQEAGVASSLGETSLSATCPTCVMSSSSAQASALTFSDDTQFSSPVGGLPSWVWRPGHGARFPEWEQDQLCSIWCDNSTECLKRGSGWKM